VVAAEPAAVGANRTWTVQSLRAATVPTQVPPMTEKGPAPTWADATATGVVPMLVKVSVLVTKSLTVTSPKSVAAGAARPEASLPITENFAVLPRETPPRDTWK
jgi:hypothetical protein